MKKYLCCVILSVMCLNAIFSQDTEGVIFNRNTHSEESCFPGTIDSSKVRGIVDMINFIRRNSHLPDVYSGELFSRYAQFAAYGCSKNNSLRHIPEDDWSCLSDSLRHGLSNSLLGYIDPSQLGGSLVYDFIRDYGDINSSVPHRKWVLFSQLDSVGIGLSNDVQAIYVSEKSDSIQVSSVPEFVAYPNGEMKFFSIFPKWSFSIPLIYNADLSECKVIANCDGENLEVDVISNMEGDLDPTIVWVIKGLFSDSDVKYGTYEVLKRNWIHKKINITVDNVMFGNISKSFQYEVVIQK